LEPLESRRLLTAAAAVNSELLDHYGQTPLAFEQNRGQLDARADFLARGSGYSLFLSDGGKATLSLRGGTDKATSSQRIASAVSSVVLQMRLLGGTENVSPTGNDVLPGKVNSFVGARSNWRTNIPTFESVRYDDVYRGIDLLYYGSNQRQLEYDFVVAPGANPRAIRLAFDGADRLQLDSDGNLILHSGDSAVTLAAPVSYQRINGHHVAVKSAYILGAGGEVRFTLGTYDATQPLVIDPVLSYSTFLGGTGFDAANDIAVDAGGNAYVTGQTGTVDFPTTVGSVQPGLNDAYNAAFVAKVSPDGTALLYSTFLGGGLFSQTVGHAIAVDASGNAYVTGETSSVDFPTTPGAFTTPQMDYDVFVTKLNSTGSAMLYSSRFGGEFEDWTRDIAVDAGGNAYVTGHTYNRYSLARLFPTTANAFQPTHGGSLVDAFVTKLNASGSDLVYSSFLGGNNFDWGEGITVDSSGAAYVTGDVRSTDFPTTTGAFDRTLGSFQDAFLTKVAPSGSSLEWSTFLGGDYGAIGGGRDYGRAVVVDATGHAFVTGFTDSHDYDLTPGIDEGFPTTPNAFQPHASGAPSGGTGQPLEDAFATKFSPDGSSLVYSTYIGGPHDDNLVELNGIDNAQGIVIDSAGYAYITGSTSSTHFPMLKTLPGENGYKKWDEVFLAKLSPDGSALAFSTYISTFGFDQAAGIGMDAAGNIYIAGSTTSDDYPTTPGVVQPNNGGGFEHHDDAFITKISDTSTATAGLVGLTLAPDTVQVGTQATGTIRLSSPAPAGGLVINLVSARPDIVTVPPSVTVPAGATTVDFSTLMTSLPPGWNFSASAYVRAELNAGLRYFLFTVNPAPFVASSTLFDVNGPSGPMVRVTFNADVEPSSLAINDLRVLTAAGQPTGLLPASVAYDPLTRTAAWNFAGAIPDGQYRAVLSAGSVNTPDGAPLTQDASVNFFALAGDANRDRAVNLLDFNILAMNFGQSNRTFSQGDFNYDRSVDLTDFNILAGRFGTALPAAASSRGGSGFGEAPITSGRLLDELLA
jgi:hypothetical protein